MPERNSRASKNPDVLKTKWIDREAGLDPRGKPWKRFYQIDTLGNAFERILRSKDRAFGPSLQELIGKVPFKSGIFELVRENKYQLVFQGQVTNINRKQGSFGLVAAKNESAFTTVLEAQYNHLKALQSRLEKQVVQIMRCGMVFLPDRRRRKELDREIFAYMIRWPRAFEPMGVNKNGQFEHRSERPYTFSRRDTNYLKTCLVELAAKAYDAKHKEGLDLRELYPEDFAVTHPPKGTPRVLLFQCRRIRMHITPQDYIKHLMRSSFTGRFGETSWRPENPGDFMKALQKAWGKDVANTRLATYLESLKRSPRGNKEDPYADALREMLGE